MNHDSLGATIRSTLLPDKRPLQSSHSASFDEDIHQYPLSTDDTYGRTYHVPPSEYCSPSTPQPMPHVYDTAELHTTYPSIYYEHAVNYTSPASTSQIYSPVGPSTPTTYGPANYRASPEVSHCPETTGPYSCYSPAASSYSTSPQTPSGAEFPQMRDRWHLRPQQMLPPYPHPQRIEMPQTISISDSTSSSQRPFCCDLCTLSFNRQHDFKRHRETHTGEKPFLCNGGCGKAFTRKDALKRHRVSVVGSDGEGRMLTRFRS